MRILVAEDDPDSLDLATQVLEDGGHTVVAAKDGEDALALFSRGPFDVVVTDWNMPRKDGVELTRTIRGAGGTYAWIILLTANDFDANFEMAMEAGVDDFLQKPLNSRLLMARLGVAQRVLQLRKKVDELSSFVPICMHCKAVRDDKDQWRSIEEFLNKEQDVATSHGMCPPCYYERSLKPDVERASLNVAGRVGILALDASLRRVLRSKEPQGIATAIRELEAALILSTAA